MRARGGGHHALAGGSVLWAKHFLVNGSPYSLGLSGPSAIATVELKRVGTQPNGVDASYPVVDVFAITHDSSYQASEVPIDSYFGSLPGKR